MPNGEPPTLGELGRRLERAESACERRAAAHVDRELYVSETKTMRGDIRDLRADFAKLEDKLVAQRRWVIGAVVVPVCVAVVGLVVAVLT